jgi:hypothetical protein
MKPIRPNNVEHVNGGFVSDSSKGANPERSRSQSNNLHFL